MDRGLWSRAGLVGGQEAGGLLLTMDKEQGRNERGTEEGEAYWGPKPTSLPNRSDQLGGTEPPTFTWEK